MTTNPDEKHEILSSAANPLTIDVQLDDTRRVTDKKIDAPDHLAGSGSLERLVEQARDFAEQATADNTNKAYANDWEHFSSWCRRRGTDPLSGPAKGSKAADPQLIGLYITECIAPQDGSPPLSVSTIERRLSGLSWNYTQRGISLDRKDRHIEAVLKGIRRAHGKPPVQKEPIRPDELLDMLGHLSFDLRSLRDRAILLVGYAGGLRRSEIVGLDANREDTEDGSGWVEIEKEGLIIIQQTKTGWKDAEIARGSSENSCPVHALEQWMHFAKIAHGPLFRRVTRDNRSVMAERLSDKHVARLIKKLIIEAAIRPELTPEESANLFSGHSLRSSLASYADVDERYVQKQLGHASVEMTRRYQRRKDRFRVNLTRAAGL